jgi:hypothetical protein
VGAAGTAFTVTVTWADAVHPIAFVAFTVYVVVLPGDTETVVPVRLPGVQVNEVILPVVTLAVSVEEAPGQTAVGLAEAVIAALLFNGTVPV